MMINDPYDLIIIKENVIPQEHIEEIMLLANDKNTSQATIVNAKTDKPDEKDESSGRTDLKVRDTLWYNITDEMFKKLEHAVLIVFTPM